MEIKPINNPSPNHSKTGKDGSGKGITDVYASWFPFRVSVHSGLIRSTVPESPMYSPMSPALLPAPGFEDTVVILSFGIHVDPPSVDLVI